MGKRLKGICSYRVASLAGGRGCGLSRCPLHLSGEFIQRHPCEGGEPVGSGKGRKQSTEDQVTARVSDTESPGPGVNGRWNSTNMN